MSASRSASTKPPLPLGKTRAETTIAKKKPASSLSTAKHKRIIHRSSSFSEQDESFSRVGSRSKTSDLKLCKDIDNSAIISKMEREINVRLSFHPGFHGLHYKSFDQDLDLFTGEQFIYFV